MNLSRKTVGIGFNCKCEGIAVRDIALDIIVTLF